MKVALVYDRVNKWGGAERVLLALHKIFPTAPLYTSLHDRKNSKWAEVFDIKTTYLHSANVLRKYNELLATFMPSAFESFSFDEYDLVISVTSEAAKGIITKPHTHHISYVLTPTRYLWSGYEDYFSNNLIKLLSKGSISYLKKWDKVASSRPDHIIAISNEVKDRIKKYYGRDSEVIFPPLFIEKPKNIKKTKGDYFLLVSRMSRFSFYKKVDLAIEAFNKSGEKLKIVGTGPMEKEFRKKARKNIEFLGEVEDRQLASYYKNAKALVFPAYEDFGLVMAEAHFFGTPVIAYGKGGSRDIVIEGKTGLFFDEQSVPSLLAALQKFDESIYNKAEIARSAERFTFEKFKSDLEKFISTRVR